ncbi:MAG: hypothetical protein V2I56_01550 [Desulfobacteraceae bacterium]|jgi:hypothetical protein|nr:hypothetical protein [Desulfobacteraceae bacterium]
MGAAEGGALVKSILLLSQIFCQRTGFQGSLLLQKLKNETDTAVKSVPIQIIRRIMVIL